MTVAIGELAGELEEGLLAFAVGAGLKVLDVILEPRPQPWPARGAARPRARAVRHGTEDGMVVLGGRQVPIRRPRVRRADGSGEVPLPTYEDFSSTEPLGQRPSSACSRSSPPVATAPVSSRSGERSRRRVAATSRSAVSRRFVAATESALAELMSADLSGSRSGRVMVDGVHFASHCSSSRWGSTSTAHKHPLALEEGDTENATLVNELFVSLRERGLDVTSPTLFVIDGAKALSSAIKAVFDHPVIARCQLHKIRNVEDKLPKELARVVGRRCAPPIAAPTRSPPRGPRRPWPAGRGSTPARPEASVRDWARRSPSTASASRRPWPARCARRTPVESMIEICRDHSTNVKHWRDGQMALRWCAAGMVEAKKQFRRVNGHLHLRSLRTALKPHVEETVTPRHYSADKEVAA